MSILTAASGVTEAGAPADEIEVTSEMIAAGLAELVHFEDLDLLFANESVVERVISAVLSARAASHESRTSEGRGKAAPPRGGKPLMGNYRVDVP